MSGDFKVNIREFDADYVRAISVRIYKHRLEDRSGGGPGAVERMLGKEGGRGTLNNNASAYDALTRTYLSLFAEMFDVDIGKERKRGGDLR